MRVTDRKTFLTMPAGTIFSKGAQWSFGEFAVKGESLENDWYYTDPVWIEAARSEEAFDRLDLMLKEGASFPCNTDESRDGMFDDEEVFLIFEHSDLMVLWGFITRALALPALPAKRRE